MRLFETTTHQQIVINDYSKYGTGSITFDMKFIEDTGLRNAEIYVKSKKTDSSGKLISSDICIKLQNKDIEIKSVTTSHFKIQTQDAELWFDLNTLPSEENASTSKLEHCVVEALMGMENLLKVPSPSEGHTVTGTDKKDVLFGGSHWDVLYGKDGDDILFGGNGNDYIEGGKGDDVIDGGHGDDTLIGGGGADTFVFDENSGHDTINGFNLAYDKIRIRIPGFKLNKETVKEEGSNATITLNDKSSITLNGMIGKSTSTRSYRSLTDKNFIISEELSFVPKNLKGTPGRDVLYAGKKANDGKIVTLSGGDGDDLLFGGTGRDYLYGDSGNDTISGGAGIDYIYGGVGDDTLLGEDGSDALCGGRGNDLLYAGNGDDKLYGGLGNDTLWGGSGNDVFVFEGGHDVIEDFSVSDDRIAVHVPGIDSKKVLNDAKQEGADVRLVFGRASSLLIKNVTLAQLKAKQDLFTEAEYHTDSDYKPISGTPGHDTIYSTIHGNTLQGGVGNDKLYGHVGDDILDGGDGDDVLEGGGGNDIFKGGAGKDLFIFDGGYGTIEDFCPTEDKIKVHLSLSVGSIEAPNILSNARQLGSDVLITFSPADSLFLKNVKVADVNPRIFTYVLIGGGGQNTFIGGDEKDTFTGGSGDDELQGQAGDDMLFGEEGDDVLYGGKGNDTLESGGGNDKLYGEEGDDLLLGGEGDDTLEGGEGNDTLSGGGGDDVLKGGSGKDLFIFDGGHDVIEDFSVSEDRVEVNIPLPSNSIDVPRHVISPLGDDVHITFDNGAYSLVLKNVRLADLKAGAVTFFFSMTSGEYKISGTNDHDQLFAGIGDDSLIGGQGNDVLDGGAGNDILNGEKDDDTLWGGEGNDALHGEEGDDALYGAAGQDTLRGGEGDDWLDGGEGNDALYGGAGKDSFVFGEKSGHDVIHDFSPDQDKLIRIMKAQGGAEKADYTAAADYDEALEKVPKGVVDAILNFRDGSSVKLQGRVTLAIVMEAWLVGGIGNDTLTGGSGHDKLSGREGDDWLEGGDGNDDLSGGEGDDWLEGGGGKDSLSGGEGDDWLDGGEGNDALSGGAGKDVFVFGEESGHDVIYDFSSDDELIRVIKAQGGAEKADYIATADYDFALEKQEIDGLFVHLQFREGSSVKLQGVAGDPLTSHIFRGAWLAGGIGSDTLTGGSRNDTLHGAEGDDALYGAAGQDTLRGGEGDDWLEGGEGNDALYGGTGKDAFVFGEKSGHDVIYDFSQDQDKFIRIIKAQGGAEEADYTATADYDEALEKVAKDGTDATLNFRDGSSVKLQGWVRERLTPALFMESWLIGGVGNDTLTGGSYHDKLSGGEGNDKLFGGAGHDALRGGEGDDTLEGGEGDDNLGGGEGNDKLFGGAGHDILKGGEGDDTLEGGEGNDKLWGGSGNDVFIFEGGHDVIEDFSLSDDCIAVRIPGIDAKKVLTDAKKEGADVRLIFGTDSSLLIKNVTLSQLEAKQGLFIDADYKPILGTPGHDTIYSTIYGNTLKGGAGNDKLYGRSGNDTLLGEEGDDTLSGGEGNDILDGGEGDDKLSDGAGDDTVRGGAGNDFLMGGEGNDILDGGAGDDKLSGSDGDDTLAGGDGDDTLHGGDGDDTLEGGKGQDTLRGADGDDTLHGGDGNDTLEGGMGKDTFIFSTDSGRDTITDFSTADDRIQFPGISPTLIKKRQDGNNVLISYSTDPYEEHALCLENVQLESLTADHFLFTLL